MMVVDVLWEDTRDTQNSVHSSPNHFFVNIWNPISILLPIGTQIRHSLIQPSTVGTQNKILYTFDNQTQFYCPFTPYYSGITPVMVGWVPDAHTLLFLITLSLRTVCHVVT